MSTSINIVILCVAIATADRVPFLPDVTFVPISNSSSTTMTSRTCDQCLSDSNASHMIINCFPNDTCQFFVDASRTYRLQSNLNAFLYCPRLIVPNASESCMPNNSNLLSRLNAAVSTYVSIPDPSSLLIDDHGYLVTLSVGAKPIVRFYPNNLTTVNQPPSPTFTVASNNIAYDSGAYYVGFSNYILVVDSSNMSQIQNISTNSSSTTRDMIFLNGGQQMIVAS